MEQIQLIKSKAIRDISLFLHKKGHSITFIGIAWTNQENIWIYFDTILDVKKLIRKYDIGKRLEIHENTDPKSGLEKGLVDPLTGEGVMGRV